MVVTRKSQIWHRIFSVRSRSASEKHDTASICLFDSEWERIRDHFPEENIPNGHPGRKPIPTLQVLEAVLWILNTGAQSHMLPQMLSELQNGASSFPGVVPQRDSAEVLTDIMS
jgi:hypothetical protein